jgi:hypothetical protein
VLAALAEQNFMTFTVQSASHIIIGDVTKLASKTGRTVLNAAKMQSSSSEPPPHRRKKKKCDIDRRNTTESMTNMRTCGRVEAGYVLTTLRYLSELTKAG